MGLRGGGGSRPVFKEKTMTGAEKTLKWYKDYVKINGVYPLIGEVESQLEMAVEEEKNQHKIPSLDDVKKHIARDCRNPDRSHSMDEQTYYEGAKWFREQVLKGIDNGL